MLSVLSLAYSGLQLSGEFVVRRLPRLSELATPVESKTARTAIGLVAGVVGILKLIFRAPGDTVAFAGDLLPALSGIVLGGLILAETLRRTESPSSADAPSAGPQDRALISSPYRTTIGFAGIAVAIVHFLLPSIVIL